MAKINLSENTGGSYIKEAGKNVLLQITHAKYNPDFGKVEMTLSNEKGETMNNNFGLMNNDGSINEKALKAFSYFARVAVGDWDRDDIEDEELVGCYIRADISLKEGKEKNKDGEIMMFANLDKVYTTNDSFKKSKAKSAVVEDEYEVSEPDAIDEDWD